MIFEKIENNKDVLCSFQAHKEKDWIDYWFYCPACQCRHSIRVGKDVPESVPKWSFNGNREKPTFEPSLRVLIPDNNPKDQWKTKCHIIIKDGMIEYCADCPHSMASKTIQMIPWNQEIKQ